MAIVQNPIIGRAKGKFGTAIFTTLFGQNILKTLPVSVRDPKTPAQEFVREKFYTAAMFIKLIYAWVKLALPVSAMQMSPFAAVLKEVYKAVMGEAGMTKVDAKKALDGFLKYKDPSWLEVIPGADLLSVNVDFGYLLTAIEAGDIIDVLAVNDTTGDATVVEAAVNGTNEISVQVSIPFTVATDDYAVYISPRKFSKFKGGNELAGAVS